ncbi:MAG: dihydrodipicolinate synthase [Pseudobdellovibrio sp.]|jgi:4-hydroxy-tetrahydrodipicolinate synthase|nr:dihydrodipicolinate synthase [Pseudobdellovibrio sp.]
MKSQYDFKGVISALPTPFLDKKVDYESLTKMVEFQLRNGINGFVVNGTTAESPTLTWQEVEKIYETVRNISGQKVPVIVGTGSNSTDETIEKTKKATDLGADAVLVVVPYYNKPPQRGLQAHFKSVAESTRIPVILYNVPGRTITAMSSETVLSLSEIKNIIAIKEASGDLAFDEKLHSQLPKDFIMLSGDDPTYVPFLKLGGHGLISVMSNMITADCVRWTKLAADKKWAEAEEDFAKYKKLISLMYVEANPIPLKWMMHKMGLFKSPEMRLPLMALDSTHHDQIMAEMKSLGIV